MITFYLSEQIIKQSDLEGFGALKYYILGGVNEVVEMKAMTYSGGYISTSSKKIKIVASQGSN